MNKPTRALRRILDAFLARIRPYNYGRDYQRDWASPEGKAYRERVFARQSVGGQKPLVDNPTFDEIRAAIDIHRPKKVLELGCGWGRILDVLAPYYDLEGCDVSDEYLARVPPGIRTFSLDIINPTPGFIEANRGKWDVIFCRGVMLCFNPEQMRIAMANLEQLAAKKIIAWELPKVVAAMKGTNRSLKFEYHRLRDKDE